MKNDAGIPSSLPSFCRGDDTHRFSHTDSHHEKWRERKEKKKLDERRMLTIVKLILSLLCLSESEITSRKVADESRKTKLTEGISYDISNSSLS